MPDLALSGILTAFPTPTLPDGGVDEPALRRLLRFLLENGVQGFVPVGGTGEYTALPPTSRLKVVEISVDVAAGKVPVVAGVLSPGFGEALEAGRAFTRAGADALMLITPFYATPSQQGIRDYFKAYRDSVDRPVLFYDIPYRTGVKAEPETIAAIAADGSVIGMKESNPDIHHFNRLATMLPPHFALLSGEETHYPIHVALGAKGGVLATSALMPRHWTRIHELATAGKLAEAIAAQRLLLPAIQTLFSETNPGPLKAAMALAGMPIGDALLPLLPPGEALMAKLRTLIADLKSQDLL